MTGPRREAGTLAILDYGAGNLRSVEFALERLGAPCRRAGDRAELEGAAGLVLPGVGAAASAMDALERRGLADALRAAAATGTPILGICLGMQLLTEASDEGAARVPCLGLLPGETRRFGSGLPLPQVGWNRAELEPDTLFRGLPSRSWFYFNHAHRVVCPPELVTARAAYGEPFPAAVGRGTLGGVQFHPEKSARAGLAVLANFCRTCGIPVDAGEAAAPAAREGAAGGARGRRGGPC